MIFTFIFSFIFISSKNTTFDNIQVRIPVKYNFYDTTIVNKTPVPIGYIEYISDKTRLPKSWIAALIIYETNWFQSRLWKQHLNPAGIKYNRFARRRTWSTDEGGQYKASYDDLKHSANGMVWLLNLKRYSSAMKAQTALEFFTELYKAGFHSNPSHYKRAALAEKLRFLDRKRFKTYNIKITSHVLSH